MNVTIVKDKKYDSSGYYLIVTKTYSSKDEKEIDALAEELPEGSYEIRSEEWKI